MSVFGHLDYKLVEIGAENVICIVMGESIQNDLIRLMQAHGQPMIVGKPSTEPDAVKSYQGLPVVKAAPCQRADYLGVIAADPLLRIPYVVYIHR